MSEKFQTGNVVTKQDMNLIYANSDAAVKKAESVLIKVLDAEKVVADAASLVATATIQVADATKQVVDAISQVADATAAAAKAEGSATIAEKAADDAQGYAQDLKTTMGDRLVAVELSSGVAASNVEQAKVAIDQCLTEFNSIKTQSNNALNQVGQAVANVEQAVVNVEQAAANVELAVSTVQSAVVDAADAKSIACAANTKAYDTERLAYATKNEAVNLYDEQNITGKKIFKEIFAGNYTLKSFAYLGNNVKFGNFGRLEDVCILGDYYYITVYDKKLFNSIPETYRPSIIKYNYKTRSIEKIMKIKPLRYKNAFVLSMCVRENGEIYGAITEDNGVYDSYGHLSCINMFKHNPQYGNSEIIVSRIKDTDGKDCDCGIIKLGYKYEVVGEGESATLIRVFNNELHIFDGNKFYKCPIGENVATAIYEIPSGYSDVDANNWTIVFGQIWFIARINGGGRVLCRYEIESSTMRTNNIPDYAKIVGMSEDVELGFVYYFSEDNRIFTISTILPISFKEIYFNKTSNQSVLVAFHAKKGEIYLMSRGFDFNVNDISCNVAHINIVDNKLITMCDIDVEDRDNTLLFIGDDDAVVIKNSYGMMTYTEPLNVHQYMNDLDLKIDHLNGLVGDTIESDYRYTEINDRIQTIDETTVKKDNNVSILNNDREYQTRSDMHNAIANALEDYIPSGGDNPSSSGGRYIVWEGRVREDEISSVMDVSHNYTGDNTIYNNNIWDFTPLNYFQFNKSDKIKIYLETNEIIPSNSDAFVDKIELLYECSMMVNDNFSDVAPEYIGEDFDIMIGIFVLSSSGFKIKNTSYSHVYNSQKMPGNRFSFQDNYVFANFANLYVTKNIDKYINYELNQGKTEVDLSHLVCLCGNNATNCRLICEDPHPDYNIPDNNFWNYEVNERPIRTAVARLAVPTDSPWNYTAYATMNRNHSDDSPNIGEEFMYYITKIEVIK